MLRLITRTVSLLALCSLPAMAGPVTLLSLADPAHPSGTAGGTSTIAGMSSDGRYVLLLSDADNLLPGVTDTNAGKDVFLQDRVAGTTVLVSHTAGDPSTAGNGAATSAALSADGRWAAFGSLATDLVAGQVDGAGTADLFLWDRTTGVSVLVSHQPGLATTAAGGFVETPGLSADGSGIVYSSTAPDLVAGQSGVPSIDVFFYDRASAANVLVSHASGSATAVAGGVFQQPVISADGNWVAFVSTAANLVAGQVDQGLNLDVFLWDRAAGTNVLVSHAAGLPATASSGFSEAPQISADGSWIAYESDAANLMAGQVDPNRDTSPNFDVFLYSRAAGTSTLVSHSLSSATTAGSSASWVPTLSADGRYVAYEGQSSDITGEATNGWTCVFVYDRAAGSNTMVHGATSPDGISHLPQISSDGNWVGFLSTDPLLVSGQDSSSLLIWNVFLWSRVSGTFVLVTHAPGAANAAAGYRFVDNLEISADGSWLAFSSGSPWLAAGGDDDNTAEDAFLFGRAAGTNTLLTPRGGAVSASAGGVIASMAGRAMSNDGRFIAFTSAAENLPGVTDVNDGSDGIAGTDVFLFSRDTKAVTLVSHASGSPTTTLDAASGTPEVSADGSYVAFASAGQLYRWDRAGGAVSLISHQAGSALPSDGVLYDFALSGDGRWIAFSHSGSSLVNGLAGPAGRNVFLYDRTSGTSLLVSHSTSSPLERGDTDSFAPAVSNDGRYVAFASYASNLTSGLTSGAQGRQTGIYLYDRISGAVVRVTPSSNGFLALSGDGRWLAFSSSASNLVPGQTDSNNTSDIFLWDRDSRSTLLVSHTPASPSTAGNGASRLETLNSANSENLPVLSADGRWVVFASDATNLVNGQTGPAGGVFLYDQMAGTVTLVSRSTASAAANGSGPSTRPAISADGRFVAYLSQAGDLVPGQIRQGTGADVFLYDRTAGTTALVSHVPASATTGGKLGTQDAPRLSADGAWVAFDSDAPDLAAGDHDGVADAFLYANPLARDFFTLTPCRILDTRQAGQGPALASGERRTRVVSSLCGIPPTARAVMANVTVTQPTAAGYLTFSAGDLAPETASTINFASGQTLSNNAILALSFDGSGAFAVSPLIVGNGTVHLVVDVTGYFE